MSEVEFIANKKPRMDDDKDAVDDVESLKVVRMLNFLFNFFY
jgi:hypothetical protein